MIDSIGDRPRIENIWIASFGWILFLDSVEFFFKESLYELTVIIFTYVRDTTRDITRELTRDAIKILERSDDSVLEYMSYFEIGDEPTILTRDGIVVC